MIKVVQGDRQTCQSFVEDLKSRVGQASPEICLLYTSDAADEL